MLTSVSARASWISSSRRDLRHQARIRGLEERACGAEQQLDHDHLDDRRAARQDQDREHRVQRRAGEVGGDHDPVAREPVGPHAAEQQQRDQRHGLRGQHEPEVGR